MKITFEGDSFDATMDAIHRLGNSIGGPPLLPPLEIGHTMIDSLTDSSTQYKLTSIGKLAVACTCMAFVHRGHVCKHIRRANGGT
jgi:hypothetical protein